jgi:hypothetical protein
LEKLQRLKQELKETKSLLASLNVNYLVRWVLEKLRDDLEKQIAQEEASSAPDGDEQVA